MGWVLALTVVFCAFFTGALAETIVQVDYQGLTYNEWGQWRSVPLNGEFSVRHGGQELGRIVANATTDQVENGAVTFIEIPQEIETITLVPVSGAQGYQFAQGQVDYTIQPGQINMPAVYAYQQAGLFTLSGVTSLGDAAQATYEVVDPSGDSLLSFETGEDGSYQPIQTLPVGSYVLRQTHAALGTMLIEDQSFEIATYTGQESQITLLTTINRVAPLENQLLGDLGFREGTVANSIYEGDQTVSIKLSGMMGGENTWALNDFTLSVDELCLLDEMGKEVSKEGVALSGVTYTQADNGIGLSVQFYDGSSAPIGQAQLLSTGQRAAADGAVSFKATYVDSQTGEALVPSGFNGGEIVLDITLQGRTRNPQKATAEMVSLSALTQWVVSYPDETGTVNKTVVGGSEGAAIGQISLPKSQAALDFSLAVTGTETPTALWTITNTGNETLAGLKVVLQLPSGWMLDDEGLRTIDQDKVQLAHTASGDMVGIHLADVVLAKGEAYEVSLPLATVKGAGDATVYVLNRQERMITLDNPKGILMLDGEEVSFPIGDGVLSRLTQGTYAKYTVHGKNTTNVAAGEAQERTAITSLLYGDENGNNLQDAGETGTPGLVIRTNVDGEIPWLAITNDDGSFTVQVKETSPLAYLLPSNLMANGLPMDESGWYHQEGLQDGDKIPYSVLCQLEGMVTADGVGVPGVQVTLSGGHETLTDESGAYAFVRLAAGEYQAVFTLVDDLVKAYGFGESGLDTQYTADKIMLGGENDKSAVCSVAATRLSTMEIKADQLPDGVTLDVKRNDVQQTPSTQGTDGWVFERMLAGEYTMTLTIPKGWALIGMNEDTQAYRDSFAWQMDITAWETVRYKLSFTPLGSISGSLETPFTASSTIAIAGQGGQYQISVKEGSFAIEGLLPGMYTITAQLPSDMLLDKSGLWQSVANESGKITAVYEAQVKEMEVTTLPSICAYQPGQVSGRIWKDRNSDGVRQKTEPGIHAANVAIQRQQADGSFRLEQSLTAQDDGTYLFKGLMPGVYRLQVETASGSALSKINGDNLVGLEGVSEPFTLASNEAKENISAGLVNPAKLLAIVFSDTNENGERGAYERLVPGTKVEVYQLIDGREDLVAQGETDKAGEASFTNMTPGEYKVTFTIPQGYVFGKKGNTESSYSSATDREEESLTQTTEVIILEEGHTRGLGCGVIQLGSLQGKCWYDKATDGLMADNEPGQENVTITLYSEKLDATYTAVTGADGTFSFDRVRSGDYQLSIAAPEGLMFTKEASGKADNKSLITVEGERTAETKVSVAGGEETANLLFGFVQGSVLEGSVFLDPNYDGLMASGDAGLAGVKLELRRTSNNRLVAEAETQADGSFSIEALRGDVYDLKVTLPNDGVIFTQTVSINSVGNWFEARSGRRDSTVENFIIGDGQNLQMIIGAVYPGQISGTIYLDNDYDGIRADGEQGASSVTVYLYNQQNEKLATEKTDRNGFYSFEELTPGAYRVAVEPKTDFMFTKPGTGSLAKTMDAGLGWADDIQVEMGKTTENIVVGLVQTGEIKGEIFADVNDNGLEDRNEEGFPGIMVTLVHEATGQPAGAPITTDANGKYAFSDVLPGRYCIIYSMGEDMAFATKVDGGNTLEGEDGISESEAFAITSGEKHKMPLAGALTLGKITGSMYVDANGSGQKENGEQANQAGLITIIPGKDSNEEQTVETELDGSFVISGLRPDTYQVVMTAQDQVFTSTWPATVKVDMGHQLALDAVGAVQPGGVVGSVWLDENNDTVRNENETLLQGLSIVITRDGAEAAAATTVTDGSGSFAVDGLIPGEYTVRIALPANSRGVEQGDSSFAAGADGIALEKKIQVLQGETITDLWAGIVKYTAIGGYAWSDQGGAIVALPNVSVTLLNESNQAVATGLTGDHGRYAFEGLMPGTYHIKVQLPSGYLLVDALEPRAGNNASVVGPGKTGVGESASIILQMGQDQQNLDIGTVQTGMLGDTAWLDENGNGLQDAGEPGIPGISVTLMKDGQAIAATQTDIYGYYLFEAVYPSTYDLEITFHQELITTLQRTDIPLLQSALPQGMSESCQLTGIEIQSNTKNFQCDFGFQLKQSGVYPDAIVPLPVQKWN